MNPSMYLVLATCAVGAPGDKAGCPCQQGGGTVTPATYTAPASPAPTYVAPPATGPVRTWLRNAFGATPPPTVVRTPSAYNTPTPNRAFPNAGITSVTTLRPNYNASAPRVTTTPVEPPAAVVEVETKEQPINMQVAKEYEGKIGHDANYDWVTGHLFYVHTDGGRWVVRYALPDETDKFGGSVVLAPGVEMRNYREGDLVCVYGEVLNEGRGSRLGGPSYRVNVISLVDRADP